VTGTAWEPQREVRDALRTIVSDPEPGIAARPSAPAMSGFPPDLLPDALRETSVVVAAAPSPLGDLIL
jgi:hypothetical protein